MTPFVDSAELADEDEKRVPAIITKERQDRLNAIRRRYDHFFRLYRAELISPDLRLTIPATEAADQNLRCFESD